MQFRGTTQRAEGSQWLRLGPPSGTKPHRSAQERTAKPIP